ncbi:hypothetical protein [Lacunimicrobium album]
MTDNETNSPDSPASNPKPKGPPAGAMAGAMVAIMASQFVVILSTGKNRRDKEEKPLSAESTISAPEASTAPLNSTTR